MKKSKAPIVSQMFVNLPVNDLPKSIAFWKALGFDFNPQFTDDNAGCLVLGENLFAMLHTHTGFRRFTPHAIHDARKATASQTALALPGRAQVNAMMAAVVKAGGREFRPAEDHGWMYGCSFQDLDGHVWEPFHMDMAAFEKATGKKS